MVFGIDPGLGRYLPAGAGSAVQPEDRAPLRGTELGEPDLAVLPDRDVSFELGAGNREDHASSFACDEPFTKGSQSPATGPSQTGIPMAFGSMY